MADCNDDNKLDRRGFLFVLLVSLIAIVDTLVSWKKKAIGFVQGASNVYFPIIIRDEIKKLLPYILGAQIEGRVSGKEQWLVKERLYQIHCKWRDVEQVQGIYDWSIYDNDFALLADYPVIVGVKVVPEWARLWPEYVGSPPRIDAYVALANFICAIIGRYPNVVAVELFNEPNCDIEDLSGFGEYFGAWIMGGDVVGAGSRYGYMTSVVYPIVKLFEENIIVLCCALIQSPNAVLFLQSAEQAGMMADAVSFHAYARYSAGQDYRVIGDLVSLYREVSNRPFVVTEFSLLCDKDSEEFREAQADFLESVIENWWDLGIEAACWYTLANNYWGWSNLVEHSIEQPSYEYYAQLQEDKVVLRLVNDSLIDKIWAWIRSLFSDV